MPFRPLEPIPISPTIEPIPKTEPIPKAPVSKVPTPSAIEKFKPLEPIPEKPIEPIPEKPREPFIVKTGRFLGLEPLGKGLALTLMRVPGLGRLLAPEFYEMEKRVERGIAGPEETEAYIKTIEEMAPKPEQVVGSAALTLASVLSPAYKLGLPFAREAPLLSTLGKWGSLGAAFGMARAFEEGLPEERPAEAVFKRVTQGALTSMVFAGLIGGVARGFEALGDSFSQAIARYSQQPAKARAYFGKTYLRGLGTQISNQIKEQIKNYEDELTNEIGKIEGRIPMRSVINEAIKLKKSTLGPGKRFLEEDVAFQEFNKALKKVDPTLRISPQHRPTFIELNWIRRQIDSKLGDRAFEKALTDLPEIKENLMLLRTTISEIIKTANPNTIPIFENLSQGLAARQAIVNALKYAEKGQFFNLSDIIAGTLVGAPWFILNRPGMALATALGAIALRNPFVQFNLRLLPQFMGKILGRPLTGIETTILQRALQR